MSGVEIPWLGFSLIGIGFLLLAIPLYFWLRNRKTRALTNEKTQSRVAIGGFAGRASNVKIRDSHSKGKITVQGKPEEIDVGGFIGQAENTEVEDSSADAEIEYKQD